MGAMVKIPTAVAAFLASFTFLLVNPVASQAAWLQFGVVVRTTDRNGVKELYKVCPYRERCIFEFESFSVEINLEKTNAFVRIVDPLNETVFMDEVPRLIIPISGRFYEFALFNKSKLGYVKFGVNKPQFKIAISVVASE